MGEQPEWGQPEWAQPQWSQPQDGADPAAPPPAAWGQARPKPGIIPLRPLNLGEIFDGAFQAIRTNPRTMLGFSAVVVSVTTLISVLPQAAALNGMAGSALFDPEAAAEATADDFLELLGPLATAFTIPLILAYIMTTVLSGLLIVAVSSAVLGRRTSARELWTRTRRRLLPLIGLSVVLTLGGGLALGICLAPGIGLLLAGRPLLGVLLLLLGLALWFLLIPIAVLLGWLGLPAPALLLENHGIFGSMRRSMQLVRRSYWRVFGILLLTWGITFGVTTALAVPFSGISAVIGATQDVPYESFWLTVLQLTISALGSILGGVIAYPFSAAVTALLYIDLRMRREGLDLELIRAAAEGTEP